MVEEVGEGEEVVAKLKRRVMAVTVYTCWTAVVHFFPSKETGVLTPVSLSLCDDTDYTAVPQQGSVGSSKCENLRRDLHSPVLRSLVTPRHWSGAQYHSPLAAVGCMGPSTTGD